MKSHSKTCIQQRPGAQHQPLSGDALEEVPPGFLSRLKLQPVLPPSPETPSHRWVPAWAGWDRAAVETPTGITDVPQGCPGMGSEPHLWELGNKYLESLSEEAGV